MRLRQYLWRVVSGFILVSTSVDFTLGLLFLTGIKRMISFGALQLIYWIPPAIERPSSHLHFLGHVDPAIAWTSLMLNSIFSLLLARGLWKGRFWAGCVETAVLLYPGVVLVNVWWRYFADKTHGLHDYFMVGNGPALLWVLVIIALLWTDRLVRLPVQVIT